MPDKDRYPSELADRFQLRLKPGLRDRIKASAERHDRSMNTEIVRVLEREFPEPWSIETRVAQVLGMMAMLKEAGPDEHIDTLADALRETLEGVVSGRMKGVDDEARARIAERLTQWQAEEREDRLEHDADDEDLDLPTFLTSPRDGDA